MLIALSPASPWRTVSDDLPLSGAVVMSTEPSHLTPADPDFYGWNNEPYFLKKGDDVYYISPMGSGTRQITNKPQFMGDNDTKIYHLPWCEQAIGIRNQTWLYIPEEAEADGFMQCDLCSSTPAPDIFLGDKKVRLYHDPSCKLVPKISKENRIWFSGAGDAAMCGYGPCQRCHPDKIPSPTI